MGIRVALRHVTSYTYDRPVTLSPHIVRLRPAPHTRTPIPAYSLTIEPDSHYMNWQQDPYSNHLARLVFLKPTTQFKVTIDLVADLVPINPFDFFIEKDAENFPFAYEESTARDLTPYLETIPAGPLLQKLIEAARLPVMQTNDYIVALNNLVHDRVSYVIRMEPGVQAPEETLALGKGSCRDSAWLLVQLARHMGIAARFASGYLIQLVEDDKPVMGLEGPTSDFTDLHAWAEIYLPGAGWIGLDATSGLLTAEGHIPLACTADPQTAAPISGGFSFVKNPDNPEDELGEVFDFEMSIRRVGESPRVTKPYTDTQWDAINALGHRIDADLREWDVRLTMGGEPTFVSAENRDADEWNIAAPGKEKREKANVLLKRLSDSYANGGGLLHFGQGKWYPGEPLPRWAFSCYWRRDGVPMWKDPALVADESVNYGYGPDEAKRFVTALAETLAVDPTCAIPSYEDAWYYMWKERRLPANLDPLDSKLEDKEERALFAKIFEQKLGTIVGYVLPIRRDYANSNQWESGPWFLRKEQLFLIPGDSAMGFRIPLDSLTWEDPAQRQSIEPQDPFAPRSPLPTQIANLRNTPVPLQAQNGKHTPVAFGSGTGWYAKVEEKPTTLIRTAFCVEPRDGRLHVFMPPSRFAEEYLDLLTAVEATAAKLKMPVRIEGYKPPHDHRLNQFSMSPDPGVLEVNLHPAHSWDELVQTTETLYEQARQTHLSTEKFMLDGRHTGTGGGNHIVIGGPTPADSPLLRKPDVLKSLVTFWNNHPSLSYLFSGMFVGPTSQHPRVDEARHDALYELEIACSQLPHNGQTPPAWLVDRLFRHLLVDCTGNTHRTEFCIDKLFSPDTAEGRRGLLELRSFEMPPHARMSLVQQLFLRSLVSWFWKKPYAQKLVRWGTQLHDRFMLPYFVNQDFNDALDEIRGAGYAFDPSWFAAQHEFRFPHLGDVSHRGVHIELRQAIEPWHVLGEESGGGGAVRYVDSSLERMQVKVRGLTDSRHLLTCNGRRIPLHPTGTHGEFVAGVRYRAWQPPGCLHPNIPVHSPLVFDILDQWNDRSVGGCTYHVSHPGGRAHERFPINGREAEGRRLSRFFGFGHTPGPIAIPAAEVNAEFPYTLDLRRPEPPAAQTGTPMLTNRLISSRTPIVPTGHVANVADLTKAKAR